MTPNGTKHPMKLIKLPTRKIALPLESQMKQFLIANRRRYFLLALL